MCCFQSSLSICLYVLYVWIWTEGELSPTRLWQLDHKWFHVDHWLHHAANVTYCSHIELAFQCYSKSLKCIPENVLFPDLSIFWTIGFSWPVIDRNAQPAQASEDWWTKHATGPRHHSTLPTSISDVLPFISAGFPVECWSGSDVSQVLDAGEDFCCCALAMTHCTDAGMRTSSKSLSSKLFHYSHPHTAPEPSLEHTASTAVRTWS